MSFQLYKLCKMAVLTIFCVLSLGGIFSGLALSVIKSPVQQASLYAEQARLTQSADMALMAVSYTPYDTAMWGLLDDMKQKTRVVSVSQDSLSILAASSLSKR